MFSRLFYMALAVLGVAIVLGAGWLWSAHNRLGGVGVLLISAFYVWLALRPSRQPRR